MKSYLRFLGRNKLYTAIEVVGLSVALAFVLILSSYIIEEISTDREVKDKGRMWVCHNKGIASSSQKFDKIFRAMPEVTDFCQFSNYETPLHIKENGLSYSVKPMYVSGNFFEFMGYELVAGDVSKLWQDERSVVISERFARNIYPGEHAVGQTLTFADNDDDEEPFWNTLAITGVYRNPEKSIVMDSDIIMNIDHWPYKDVPGVDMGAANLLRLAKGTDHEELCERLYKEAAANGMVLYEAGLPEPLMLTSFSNMDLNVAKIETAPFINLTDRIMMKRFFIVCIILLGFAILNYISLTIAFSRFRSKEMAARRILGTTKGSLTIRSFIESFCLTATAFALGITIACIIQEKASAILETEISIFSNPAEIIWSLLLIIILSTVTGLAPAFISSKGKPINIIKGEERYKDKQILGKAFIFIQAAISIVCLSTAMAYWLQTRKMLDTPLGYRTENILAIKGIPIKLPAGLEEIPCVGRVGKTALVPIDGAIMKTSRELADERLTFHITLCDSTTLSILGIEMTEIFKSKRGASDTFVTESSAQWMRNLCSEKGVSEDRIKDICDGVISEMRFGNHSGTTEGITAIIVQENRRLPGALNRGFEEARGEFYTWTSADNIMLEGCIKTMVEELEANKDADMVYGNMYLMDSEDNRITGHGWFEFPVGSGNVILPDSTLLLNTVANNTIGAAFMYRAGAECVLGGYSNRLYLLEDYDYFMKMNSLFKIRHISKKEPVYAYRMHKDSLTAHDEELGITASRPKLMKFDKIRRKVYNKPIYAKIQGNIPVDLKEVGIHDKKNSRILICDNHIYNEETRAEYIFEVKRCSDGSFEVKSNGKAVRLEDIRDTGLFLRYALWCRILRDAESKYIL